ncbi:MAG: ABC transporter permease subunit [Enterobacteriaceae bacterium]
MLGVLLSIFISLFIFFPIKFIFFNALNYIFNNNIYEKELNSVIYFTIYQSLISTIISVTISIFIAKILHFSFKKKLKNILLIFCYLSSLLPSSILVIGIIKVFGNNGLLNLFLLSLGIKYNFSIYNIYGIIITHIFLNIPISILFWIKVFENIPIEHLKISSQLNISGFYFFYYIELPNLLNKILIIFFKVFIFCISSFNIPLILGGPTYTTISLEIFYSFKYLTNLNKALYLSMIHIFICLFILFISNLSEDNYFISYESNNYVISNKKFRYKYFIYYIVLFFIFLFLISPPFMVIVSGINSRMIYILKNKILWISIFNSVFNSFVSSLICIIISIILVWSYCNLKIKNKKISYLIVFIGKSIIVFPNMVFTFYLINLKNKINYINNKIIIIFLQSLVTLPYLIQILKQPMLIIFNKYNKICNSLNIVGFKRLKLIDLKILRYYLKEAFIFSNISIINNINILLLFNEEISKSISLYLYNQIGSFYYKDSFAISLILLVICILIIKIINFLFLKKNDPIKKFNIY